MKPILEYFDDVADPRIERTKLHKLSDILGITLCATLAGMTGWDTINDFATERIEWLQSFLELENGVPSADTFRRVISRINREEFQNCFIAWVAEITSAFEGVVSIDGKTIRNKRVSNPIHLVSAWAEMNDGICLGQVATDEKSNEITAIPNLLDCLDIAGCIVTIDAMGCQKKIVDKIVLEKQADYCLAVKGNQPSIHSELKAYFDECDGSTVKGANRAVTRERSHGRDEERVAYVSQNLEAIPSLADWTNACTVGMILNKTTLNDGRKTVDKRYFISSASLSATRLLATVRAHWGIENRLHWVLDVTFKEDGNRIGNDGQENLATTRKIALTLLKQEKSKLSIKRKMIKSALSPVYMSKVLQLG